MTSLVLQLLVLYTPLAGPFGVRGLSGAEWIEVVVATAASGEEGLELARELAPSLITLDVMMPGTPRNRPCRAS